MPPGGGVHPIAYLGITGTETVIERTKCLLNTTGIEPLRGELSEIQSRTFVINFDIANQGSDCFSESEIVADIQKHRDLILFAIMKRTRHVLAMMREGRRTQALRLLHEELADHDKRRCNEYLSLMYLMLLAGSVPEEIEAGMQRLVPSFVRQIQSINRTSRETARESNPIATALTALFKAYRHALEADAESTAVNVNKTNKAVFFERYQIDFRDEARIEGALARDLFVALKGVARWHNLRFDLHSVQQFAQRFSNDLETIREVGFEIAIRQGRGNTRTYDISCISN